MRTQTMHLHLRWRFSQWHTVINFLWSDGQFLHHTAHCFLLLLSCMLYVVTKHCPEEAYFNSWAKCRQNNQIITRRSNVSAMSFSTLCEAWCEQTTHRLYAVCVLCARCAEDSTLSNGVAVVVFVCSAFRSLGKLGSLKLNYWQWNID